MFYEIRVQDHLDQHWSAWLGGMHISHEQDGTTRLRGQLPDEAALYGVLMKIRDLGPPLLMVRRVSTSKRSP